MQCFGTFSYGDFTKIDDKALLNAGSGEIIHKLQLMV